MNPPAKALLSVHRLRDDEVEQLLASGERRVELRALFGDTAYRELSALARRAAVAKVRGGPRVYVLPGLMGSRLGTRGTLLDDVLWLDLVEIAAGHLTRLALPRGAGLQALGAMLINVLKLKLSLQVAGFDARMHAYDWRLGVADLAAALGRRIQDEGSGNAMLVGHSMGGLVARAVLGTSARPRISRVVQLGSPNSGSFAPVLALRGVYPTVRKLAAIDLRHDAEDLARIVFRTLPALHELLPDPRVAPAPTPNLFDVASWPDDPLRPDPALLTAAAAARAAWPTSDSCCLHVVGVRQDTITHARRRGRDFEYTLAPEGDGTVPTALALLPGQSAWFVAEKHGELPNNGRVIAAVIDLLRRGTTTRLPTTARRARAGASRTITENALRRLARRKVRWQSLSPDARRRLLEPVVSPEFHGAVASASLQPQRGTTTGGDAATPRRVLELRLVHGSITEANARAIVLGIFRNVDPAGAAAAVDHALAGAIREFTLRRMFSGNLGQVFVLPAARGALLAELVLFAGLGDFDDFGGDAQVFAAENVVRTLARTRIEDFATVLFGTGSGVPVALAVEHQLRGFLRGVTHADPEHVVRRITIAELDRGRYRSLVRASRRLGQELAGDGLDIVIDEMAVAPAPATAVVTRPAPPRRAGAARSDPVYLLVNLLEPGRSEYECRSSLLTAGAKAAVLTGAASFAKRELLQLLAPVESGAHGAVDMARFGTNLARLLLARSVREGLEAMANRPLVVVHDREASRVPWEALRIGGAHPALVHGISRRYASDTLTVARWREDRMPGDRVSVLLVVNPTLDLPGAAAEGEALRALLGGGRTTLELLAGGDATRGRVIGALASGRHDVLHFAGHGYFDATDPGRSGLVCAGQDVLRGSDLDGLGNLPALVFFNACEAARVRRPSTRYVSRLFGRRRSSSIAEAFLAGGVAVFLGTHWPVGDAAALAFSTCCYERLLAGADLGAAVLAGRQRVHETGSLDWADYVHYGNPAFRLGPPDNDTE